MKNQPLICQFWKKYGSMYVWACKEAELGRSHVTSAVSPLQDDLPKTDAGGEQSEQATQ